MASIILTPTTFEKCADTVFPTTFKDNTNLFNILNGKGVFQTIAYTFPLASVLLLGPLTVNSATLTWYNNTANNDATTKLSGPGAGNLVTHSSYPDNSTGVGNYSDDVRQVASHVFTFSDYSAAIPTGAVGAQSVALNTTGKSNLQTSINAAHSDFSIGWRGGAGSGTGYIEATNSGAGNEAYLTIDYTLSATSSLIIPNPVMNPLVDPIFTGI